MREENMKTFLCFYVIIIFSQVNIASMGIQDVNIQSLQPLKVEDIHVEAFVRDRRILQLNVTLLKPIGSIYDVKISSVEGRTNRTSHCKVVDHCIIHGVDESQTSIILPEHNLYISENEHCHFENDCTYNISAKALTGKLSYFTIYHVKECVNGLCSCRNASRLPKPILYPKLISPKQLFIKWEVPTTPATTTDGNAPLLQYLTIDIEEMRDCNLSVGNIKSIASFHEKLDNYGVPVRTNNYTKELSADSDAKCLRIRMCVVDSQNCQGPQVLETVSLIVIGAQQPSMKENISWKLIAFCVAGGVITTITIILVIYALLWKNRRRNIFEHWWDLYYSRGAGQMIPMRDNVLYFEKDSDEDWCGFEIPHDCIREIGREIGKGAFGRVFIARINDIPGKLSSQIVAIKKLKKSPTTDQLEEFLGEISTMKRVGKHQNVVRLLGFCTLEQPLMMIMEFVPCGDLLKYLRTVRAKHESLFSKLNNNSTSLNNNTSMKHSTSNHSQILGPLGRSSASETSSYITQPDSLPSALQANGSGPCTSRPSFAETMYTNLTSNSELTSMLNTNLEYVVDHKELHNFAIQIARGMKHLQDLQITHRDLAARNILINENKTLKISDFGLSRTGIYVNTKNKKVPLRWLSVEAMKDNLYSSKSDVWAFAIVLWEIGTLGGFPYPTVSNHELLNFLKSGDRLERPENCSETLYELMLQCWATDPNDRPDFGDISRKLDPNKNKIYIDFSELSPNYVFPPTSEECTTKKVT